MQGDSDGSIPDPLQSSVDSALTREALYETLLFANQLFLALEGRLSNGGKHDISNRITVIVRELEKATVEVARLVEEGERQAELKRQRWAAQQEQWRREEAERRAAKALKESKEELLEIIEAGATSKRLEEFFADVERRPGDLPEIERGRTEERLRRARKMIGGIDALDRIGADSL